MALKRILALLLAAGLVVGALQLRERLDRPAGPEVAGDPTEPRSPTAPAGAPALVCLPELAEVCAGLAEALGEDGRTVTHTVMGVDDYLAALTGGDGPAGTPSVWLTIAPLPAIAAQRLQAAGAAATVGDAVALGRSPLVAAVWDDRADVLAAHCGGVLTWRCVGDAAGGGGTWADIGGPGAWGPVKPSFGDPSTGVEGLLVLGQLAAGYFGRTDVNARDIDDPGFFAWFTDLERAVPARPPTSTPLRAMVQFGPASVDLVGVTEAGAVDLLQRSGERASTLALRAIEPVAVAQVVAVPVGQELQLEELMGAVAAMAPAELARAGWRVEGQPASPALTVAGVGDIVLPDGTALPSAGALEALRRTWSEVAR